MRPLRLAMALVLLTAASACIMPPPASERASDAARELNLAARFGRMDVAVERTAGVARQQFIERHSEWGRSLRIVDIELAGIEMSDTFHALVYVDISWERMDEGTLRVTRLAQSWQDEGKGWQLMRERRVTGDLGLFGERVATNDEPHPDVHFASKTIR